MNEERKGPFYQFSATVELGQGKQTQIIGSVPMNATTEEMNAELDKVWAVLARQRVRELELPTAEQALEDQKNTLDRIKNDVGPLMLKSQAGKLNGAERSNLETQQTTIRRLEENIPKGEAFVEDLRKKAA